jgi:hypothetical protein
MIKFENTEVIGWEAAIRGMRNPMNSWEKSDSLFDIKHHGAQDVDTLKSYRTGYDIKGDEYAACKDWTENYAIGPNDLDLMKRLRNAGTDHRKFMRMITVYVDILAPLYWWKEFDTYKVGTVANSCSTMHKIAAKAFTLEDFSCEYLRVAAKNVLLKTIEALNAEREAFIGEGLTYLKGDKECWYSMIQLLPNSYNQRRTVMLNYEVLANIYKSRKNHKLDEWAETKLTGDCPADMYPNKFTNGFCDWIKTLPYSELITGEEVQE